MNILLAFLIAVIVFCSYLVLDQYRLNVKRRNMMRARITPDGTTTGADFEESMHLIDGEPSPRAKTLLAILRGLGVHIDETLPKIERMFGQAGMPSNDGPIYYLFFQRVVSIFLLILAAVYMMQPASKGIDQLMHYAVGGFVALLAVFGPYLYIKNKIDHRRKKLLRAFPDTLDLLLICVESGLALDAALTRVCSELGRAYPEMTQELNRTRLELSLINDRVRALMNLGERTGMVAFRSLVAALIQSERFGTSLTDTMRVLSEDFRLMRLSEAEAKAARLPVILTIPLILLLMPSLMLIILGPAIVTFVRNGQLVTGAK
jgi:tight adherence protein C